MTINRVFIGYMILVGVVLGVIVAIRPGLRDFPVPPQMWVLIFMLLFEAGISAWYRVAPGSAITMVVRLAGFIVAALLTILIPIAAAGGMF